ncbi:MAG: serine/threonine-protein kinase [Planctomycetota bacterium]
MSDANPSEPADPVGGAAKGPGPVAPSWEAFYRDYRKPGFVEGFEITSKLGGGMFGLVFRARRTSIGKDYAIKFLQVDDTEVRRAVLSELEQVKYFAQIDHPNLVSIEDRGEVHGIPYLVMAFAGTDTLRDVMPLDRDGQGCAPTAEEKPELLRAFLQACRGLSALHERSLVHFDIKPANVFLKGGVARLGDYGLSKLVTHSRGSLSLGRGTPYYMAPEMLQRKGDARSDIYSLGIMLYELLCGQVPFSGDSEWEVLKKHEHEAPELPAHLTPTEREVLQRCLAKRPEDRFASVQELVQAFGAPQSPGAATWSDVRSGLGASSVGASARVAPPLPGAAQARAERPGSGADDAAQQEASSAEQTADDDHPYRKAWEHATKNSREAMHRAVREAKQAAGQAASQAKEAVQRTRTYSVRRWKAMKELHRSRRTSSERQQMQKMAAAIVRPAKQGLKKASSGAASVFRYAIVIALSLALALGVIAVVLMTFLGAELTGSDGPQPTFGSSDSSAGGQSSAMAFASTSSSRPTFSSWTTYSHQERLVSTAEPGWARETSERAAKRGLMRHIERLRTAAPFSVEARTQTDSWPRFFEGPAELRNNHLRKDLEQLLLVSRPKNGAVSAYFTQGAAAMAIAARRMSEVDWYDAKEARKGLRLHNLLAKATGCRDIVAVDGNLQPAERAAVNGSLGSLWLWFVNEFAHTERTWRAYNKLL